MEEQHPEVIDALAMALEPISRDQESNDYRIENLADAMRSARINIALQESEEYNDPDPYGYVQELEIQTDKDFLEPRWKSRPDEDLWNRRTKARARKLVVAKMYLMGYPTSDIAKRLLVSEHTVVSDINVISKEWRKSYLDDIETLASRDLARLDEMFNKLAPAIERGDTRAIKAGVEVIRERGNILGYREGVQIDIEEHVRQIAASQGLDPDEAVIMARRISVRYAS